MSRVRLNERRNAATCVEIAEAAEVSRLTFFRRFSSTDDVVILLSASCVPVAALGCDGSVQALGQWFLAAGCADG
jgi:hypothetical protein